jgi:hypothetical protein
MLLWQLLVYPERLASDDDCGSMEEVHDRTVALEMLGDWVLVLKEGAFGQKEEE